jgi:type II secretory pathway pseudopilin PulG
VTAAITGIVVAVVILLLLAAAFRLWLTANRLDRLHLRTEAAWAALEQALARRIVAARAIAAAGHLPPPTSGRLRELADAADAAPRAAREVAERSLGAALDGLREDECGDLAPELADAAERVVLARQFYNDAVRDTRGLRASWFTRLFGLAGHALLPEYFGQPPAAAAAPDNAPATTPPAP